MDLAKNEPYKSRLAEELAGLNFRAAKLLCMLGIFIVPLSLIFDYLIPGPEHFPEFVTIRLSLTAFLVVLLIFASNDKYKAYGKIISALVTISVGLGISLIIRIVGYEHSYYAVLNLIYFAIMIIPAGPVFTTLISSAVFSFYLIPIFLFDMSRFNSTIFSNNAGFQLETIIIAILFSYFNFNRIKNDIMNRLLLEEAKEQLKNVNLNLEEKVKERTKELEALKDSLEITVAQRTTELNQKVLELERMNKFMEDREFRIIELKKEIEKLKDMLKKNGLESLIAPTSDLK